MSERSELMKLYLKNGITSLSAMKEHYNSFPEGGPLTREQYIQQQRDIARKQAYQRSINRTTPEAIKPMFVSYSKGKIDNLQAQIKAYTTQAANTSLPIEVRAMWADKAINARKQIEAGGEFEQSPSNCLYTALSDYGVPYRVMGNQTFYANPSKYGFERIPIENVQQGDVVQYTANNGTPIHAAIYNTTEGNKVIVNYSNGDAAYKTNAYYGSNPSYGYRFVGNQADLDRWNKEYDKQYGNSFATGGALPDYDPEHLHYHDSKGNKIEVTKEDWERYKDDPTFREIRAAVELNQKKYPGPEYDEVENPAWSQAYNILRQNASGNNGSLAVNWWNGKSYSYAPLPEGYTRDKYGVVTDAQGNYYTPLPNSNNSSFSTPHRGIHGGVDEQYYGQVTMPERTIRVLKQPLPVDKTLDVTSERKKAIQDYINNNNKIVKERRFFTPFVQTGLPNSNDSFIAVPNDWFKNNWYPWTNKMSLFVNNQSPTQGEDVIINGWRFLNLDKPGLTNNDINVLIDKIDDYSQTNEIDKAQYDKLYTSYDDIINTYGYMGFQRMHPTAHWETTPIIKKVSPNLEEAEQKAIIPLFALGGLL